MKALISDPTLISQLIQYYTAFHWGNAELSRRFSDQKLTREVP